MGLIRRGASAGRGAPIRPDARGGGEVVLARPRSRARSGGRQARDRTAVREVERTSDRPFRPSALAATWRLAAADRRVLAIRTDSFSWPHRGTPTRGSTALAMHGSASSTQRDAWPEAMCRSCMRAIPQSTGRVAMTSVSSAVALPVSDSTARSTIPAELTSSPPRAATVASTS